MDKSTNAWVQVWKEVAKQWFDKFLDNPFVMFIWKLFIAIIVVAIMLIISKIIAATVRKKIIKNNITDDEENITKIWNLVWDIIFYTLLTFSVFIGFDILWFDLWILLWWISFWLWFAFKEILSNMIAGVIVLSTKDYKLWDFIEIEWKYHYRWYIEEITIRYITIRSLNNQKIIIPNLEMIINPIKTFTSEEILRWETQVSISYDDDIEKAKKVIINVINKQKYIVNKEKINVIVESFWDSWINLLVRFYFDPNWDMWYASIKSEINTLIKKVLEENNINIPYPHTTLTVDKNDQNVLKTILFAKK